VAGATGDSAGESVDQEGNRAIRGSGHHLSRRGLVWLAAIASQVVLIGGVFTWSYYLAEDAIGSSPTNATAVITVWVSDPSWHVAPELDIGQHSWVVTLSTQQGNSFGVSHPDAEAVVVLWGDAELSDPHPACWTAIVGENCARPMSSASPGSYQQVQVPQEQASFYVENFLTGNVPGFSGPTVPAEVFRVTAHDYYATGAVDRSVFPVVGQPSSGMETTTSTGWSAFMPSASDAGSPIGCSAAPAPLPPAIADATAGSTSQVWYGTGCPTPSIELITGASERFSDSTVPPSSIDYGIPIWTDQPETPNKSVIPDIGGFSLDVADPAIAAAASRDVFFAGVLAGIAGGLLAGWLAAGATFIVKRSIIPTARLSRATGEAPSPKSAQG
jgi:hypothetical protein